MKKRILALLLAIIMVIGMVPVQAFATETEPAEITEEVAETTALVTEAAEEKTEASAVETEAPAVETEAPTEEVLVVSDEDVTEAADPVKVYMTVSNKGVLAKTSDGQVMLNKAVTVSDVNEDGILTYDEALVAAHAAYCPGGYVTSEGTYGTQVDKIWGVSQSPNFYFIVNNVALSMNVADSSSVVKAGDKLYTAILSDTTRGADYYTYYTDSAKSVESGEEFTLTLKGYGTLAYPQTAASVSGISVGTWENGVFTAIEGKTTDENGQVTLFFDQAGTYYVTASGSVSMEVTDWTSAPDENGNYATVQVNAPTMAPFCVVTVTAKEEEQPEETVSVTVGFAAQEAVAFMAPPQLALTVSSDTAENYGYTDQTDKTKEVSTIDVLVAAHAAYYGDAFTEATATDYLIVNGNFITKMFAGNNGGNVCLLVNGKQPGSNGVEQAAVETGDLVEFFIYQDLDGDWSEGTQYTDKYVWLELTDGTKLDGQTVYGGKTVTAVVMGYSPFLDGTEFATGNVAVSGAGIYLVDISTGKLTSLGVTSGEDGTVSITVPAAYVGQTLYLAAKGDCMAMTLAKVTVEEAPVNNDCDLTTLQIAVGAKTAVTDDMVKTLTPDLSSDVTEYTTEKLDYIGSTKNNYVWIKAEAGEGATITAENGNSGVTTLTAGEWTYLEYVRNLGFSDTYYYGTLSDGAYNNVAITVTASDGSTKAYTVTIPVEVDLTKSALAWTTDLSAAVYYTKDTASPKALTVEAKYNSRPLEDTNEITYQWYSNTTASTEGGAAIEGATETSYTPSVAALGKSYYYVIATCGEKTLTSSVTEVTVTEQAAPTSITISSEWAYTLPDTAANALGGKDYVVAVNDVMQLKAVDQDGNETPVVWKGDGLYGGTLDADTGKYTVTSNSYSYVYAVSLYDSSIKSDTKVILAKMYTANDQSVTLSTNGQTAVTIKAYNDVSAYTAWNYTLPEGNIATLKSDTAGLEFNALRPGIIEVSLDVDLDQDGVSDGNQTDTATLTINGIAVEDASGNLGSTRLEISSTNANPTVQLTALSSTADDTFTWTSADETVATVDENGLVTAQGVGTVIITAKGTTYTGGIKVTVTHGEIPYFEVLDFTTGYSNNCLAPTTWKTANFKPTTLDYTGLKLYNAASSTLVLKNTTVYDTEKYTAVASYIDANGEEKAVTVNSGAVTNLTDIPFGTITVTITLTDKTNETVKTAYTFEVTRPRDTVKTIATSGIVFNPDGRDAWKDQYNSKTEGVMYVANTDGSFAQYQGVSATRYYYRTYAMNALEAFTLTLRGSTAFTHIRYSTDDGETWNYLGQTGTSGLLTDKITFPEAEEGTNPVVKVMIQILDDSTYAANVAAEKDGFADATPTTYTVWVEQIPVLSEECDILTATTDTGDWYPAFDKDIKSYRVVVGSGAAAPVLSFTVSEDATVIVDGTAATAEDGVYTLTLGSSNSVTVKSSSGSVEKTYTFGYSAKSAKSVPDKVVDYLLINGQYINGAGSYGIIPTQTLTDNGLLSLGNFGGYITYYYENGLTDNPNNAYGVDFYINGNAFVDQSTGTGLGSMEPGQVWVSEDGSTWYALAGSEHYDDDTIWNYTVTYTKTETGGTDWSDNYGNTMSSTHGRSFTWPDRDVYSLNKLLESDTITLSGVLLPCWDGTITGADNFGSYSSGAKFGYVDVLVNGTANPYLANDDYKNASSGFDLAWAVDAAGNPVDVSGKSFHYVKIVTASNIMAGSANEKSTEVAMMYRADAQSEAVGVTTAPYGVTFQSEDNTYVLDFEEGKQVYEVELSDMDAVSVLVNGTADDDNIYINSQRVTSGTASGTFQLSASSQKLIRIIVQNGEKEPVIYLLKVKSKADYGLSDLKLYKELSAYQNGEDPLPITPEFDGSVRTGYTASAPDYNSYVYLVATVDENTVAYTDTVWVTNNWGGWSGTRVSNGLVVYGAYYVNKGYAGIFFDNRDLEYQVAITPYATLKGLTMDGVWDQSFNRDVNAYHVYADSSAEGITITPTGYKTAYTITINGTEVTSGSAYTLPYAWDDQGKMQVTIEVSGSSVVTSTYTVELEKMPLNDAPYVMKESGEADYTAIDKASYVQDLFVTASANGSLTYQWYYNSVASTEGGTLIEGATESTYTPPITEDVIGTRYYYCQITNDGAEEGNVTFSTPTRVTVDPDPTPVAIITNPGVELSEGYEWNVGYVYAVGEEPTGLTVEATTAVDGELTYRWFRPSKAYNSNGWSSVSNEATSSTYYPLTTLNMAADAGKYYACEVTCTFKGRTYTSRAVTGATYTEGEGDSAKTYNVDAVYVYITVDEAAMPTISTQPKSASYFVDDSMSNLTVSATRADGGTMTYQWYVNDEATTEGATAIEGATRYYYSLGKAAEKGTKYYYCVVTNTIQGYTATVTSDIAEIAINTIQDVIGDRLTGTGTAEDPYLIADAQDYQDVYEFVAAGISFQDLYLKQVNDITLPEGWESIGVLIDPSLGHINAGKNMAAFRGTLDGNGKTVTIPEGGHPLFGYVRGATIKNLNIYGKKIAGYGLVDHLEGVSLSGEAVCIDNVTLKSGSSTLKSGLIGTYLTNNGFAGCSAAYYVTIKNCTIEKDVVIGYDKDQTYIGSIAGRVHGTIENCVSYATVYGKNYVGGILGTRDNAMGTCSVTNCEFYGTVEASGDHAGGIAGGGYQNSTAPNGVKISINDCTVNASVTGADKVGGIIGGDTYVAQAWNAYTLTNNSFSGQVKATEGTYVGAIIGYYLSLNNKETVSGNTYSMNCGADRGIGFVQYVDTSYENPTKIDGVVYLNTATSTEDCPAVNGCSWKTGYNRTDDPLGVDAGKLAASAKVAASVSEELMGGKSMTLSLVDAITGKAIKAANVKWALLNAEDAAYVTLTAAGKLTASVISDSHDVVLVATVNGGPKVYHTVTVYPAVAYMDIILNDSEIVTGQTLKRNVNVEEEQTLTLSAELYPADAKDGGDWKSSNPKIASVDKDGKVTYEGKPGTVTITATAQDGSKKTATVKITFAALTAKVTIGEHADTLASGASMTLKADTTVVWSLKNSADKSYVTLYSNGTLKAKTVYEEHVVTVVATSKDGNASDEATITIQPKAGILVLKHGDANVTKTTQTVDISDATYELTAALYGGDAQSVTWRTSNKRIISLPEVDGETVTKGETVALNLLRAGTATITATAEDGTKTTVTIKVTTKVTDIDIVDASGNTDGITVASGKSVKLKAVVTPAKAANKSVTWTVAKEDAAYASISILGNLTAAKKLTSTRTITVYATAKDGSGKQAEQKITIQPLAQEIRLQKGAHTVNMQGQPTMKLTASVYPAAANQTISWKSSNTKIAAVAEDGTVTFLKGGSVTITASTADGSNKCASIKLTVVKSVTELGLDDQHVTGTKSLNLAKLVEIYPSDATNKKLVWSMAYADGSAVSKDVATLSGGTLKAKDVTEVKTVYVTATAADGYGASVTTKIDIYPQTKTVTIELDGENVTGQTIELAEGESLQLTGVNAPDDAWQEWTWKSSNGKVLEVDEDGCVTGITAGKNGTVVTVTCTAADGTGRKATVKIKVVKAAE